MSILLSVWVIHWKSFNENFFQKSEKVSDAWNPPADATPFSGECDRADVAGGAFSFVFPSCGFLFLLQTLQRLAAMERVWAPGFGMEIRLTKDLVTYFAFIHASLTDLNR